VTKSSSRGPRLSNGLLVAGFVAAPVSLALWWDSKTNGSAAFLWQGVLPMFVDLASFATTGICLLAMLVRTALTKGRPWRLVEILAFLTVIAGALIPMIVKV
jgi:hypothetical protein